MRDQTAREPKFPAACARCGGRISEPVTFCPHCGAHARFALAGDAPHASQSAHAGQAGHASQPVHAGQAGHTVRTQREPRGAAASVRPAPTVPPYDFEGDLDPPWPGPPTPLFASPDGDPYGEVRAPGFRGERQWGLKWGTALIVGAFVVLYGGAVAVHRYDGALPLSQSSSSKSAEGAIASNGSSGSNLAAPSGNNTPSNGSGSSSNALQPPAPVVENTTPAPDANGQRTQPNGSPPTGVQSNTLSPNATASNGASSNGLAPNDAVRNSAPPAPKTDDSRPSGMSIASLPPPAAIVQAAPSAAPAQTPSQTPPSAAPAQTPPQTPPSAAPAQTRPQTPPSPAQDSRAIARGRSHARSVDARSVGDAAGLQSGRLQSQQREPAQFGHAAAARALDNAQAQLAKSDLRGARASLARALAADPNNSGALSLRDQLVAREQERDASLSAAHACVVQSRWNCVWHNAGKALSVDASSTEARALVNRAIVESGAATTPAGPGPDNVQVPMVQ